MRTCYRALPPCLATAAVCACSCAAACLQQCCCCATRCVPTAPYLRLHGDGFGARVGVDEKGNVQCICCCCVSRALAAQRVCGLCVQHDCRAALHEDARAAARAAVPCCAGLALAWRTGELVLLQGLQGRGRVVMCVCWGHWRARRARGWACCQRAHCSRLYHNQEAAALGVCCMLQRAVCMCAALRRASERAARGVLCAAMCATSSFYHNTNKGRVRPVLLLCRRVGLCASSVLACVRASLLASCSSSAVVLRSSRHAAW